MNNTVSGSEAVDLSEQIAVVAQGNITVSQTNQLLDATANALRLTNDSTLNNVTAQQLTVATLSTVTSISTVTTNEPTINMTSQESIANNIADTLSTLVDTINLIPVTVTDPIQVESSENTLISQVLINIMNDLIIPLNSSGSANHRFFHYSIEPLAISQWTNSSHCFSFQFFAVATSYNNWFRKCLSYRSCE